MRNFKYFVNDYVYDFFKYDVCYKVKLIYVKMMKILQYNIIYVYILVVVCEVGFIGKFCDEKCKFLNYGYGCQQ